MRYTIYAADTGQIKRLVECPEDMAGMQVGEGEVLLEGSPSFTGPGYIQSGQFVSAGTQPSPHHYFDFNVRQWIEVERSYIDKRIPEYPPIGDQLDALWHAMDQNTLPRIEPFYSQIKAVKDRYPKP